MCRDHDRCDMTYTVSLENFEGPLDLLLYLVRKNEIDIQYIPIVAITEQYLAYIELMQAMNIDVAGEFLLMAATLVYLKSRSLLPQHDEEDPPDEQAQLDALKQQLIEHARYRDVADQLREYSILDKDVFTRTAFPEPMPDESDAIMQEASLFDLLGALRELLDKSAESSNDMLIDVEPLSVKDRMNEILECVGDAADGCEFVRLFMQDRSRLMIITTFLAMLELIKMQAVRVFQNTAFSTMYLYPVKDDEPAVPS